MKKYITRAELFMPYVAATVAFLSATNHLDNLFYFAVAILSGIYFFPIKLLIVTTEKLWFRIATSLLFANILVLLGIYILNPELSLIGTALDLFSILCIVLLVYKYIFEKLSFHNFILLIGFNILAISRVVV